ncbi:hypothetical protein AVEN_253493-1 [Araneus ventricosus]|uniref:Uncharacterized protein n=1 Tax=Araneus ventricosus TaxID=182803 RepID=A0A4Y2BSV3_ARAVE|nr:hypothetical protein AVEN_253493-1 [Araneus ventricosus]
MNRLTLKGDFGRLAENCDIDVESALLRRSLLTPHGRERGSIVGAFRLGDRRVENSRSDAPKDSLYDRAWYRLYLSRIKCPPARVMPNFKEEECRLRCRPRHLTTVKNFEVFPKIALV